MECILQSFLDDLELAGNIHQLQDVLGAVAIGLGLGAYAYLALANSPSQQPRSISNYDSSGSRVCLAPLYDIASTLRAVRPSQVRLAMNIRDRS